MIRLSPAGAALAALLVLASTAAAAPRHAAHAKATPAKASAPAVEVSWPQASSDIPADPDIRFGVLPNGMRYAIKKQAIPPGQASIRLWIGAGAMEETDAQQGLAHFLEHMAFNGSKAVKEGEMVHILERLGLAFGPDTNASTGFDETVYKLDLPHADTAALDTSLMLMRETASELTIAQGAVDRERGVVLSEERARDTPSYRITKQRMRFLFAGQRLPERMPIGKVDVLKTAPAGLIADFYQHYYRPERAVLVVVGDFDPGEMEAKVRARFADWRASAPPRPDPPRGEVEARGEAVKLVIEPGSPLGLQLVWAAPPDPAPDTVDKERRELVAQLGLAVINRRFLAQIRSTNPPFISAQAGKYEQNKTARLSFVSAVAETGRWREALSAVEQEERRAVQYGVRQDELDREIVETRAQLRAAAEGAATRTPANIADTVVGSLFDREVVTSPAQDLEQFDLAVKGLTAQEVSSALKDVFTGSGPLLFMASPQPIEGGEAALQSALDASRKIAVAAPVAPAQVAWPYASFGPPGKVAQTSTVADLGTTFVRFENGVRLTIKPTTFQDNEALVRVNIGRGLLDLSPLVQSTTWGANQALLEGGLAKISNEDMERVLADKVYGVRFGAVDDAFVLSGGTRTADLPTQLQLLAAYASDPGWRPEAFQRLKASGATLHDQYEATDAGVLSRDLGGLLHGGDRRWTFPSRQEIADAKLDDLRHQIAPLLAQGQIEVVVVGDVKVDQVIQTVAATFGALPARPKAKAPPAEQQRTPLFGANAEPLVETHKGRADQAIGYVAWPTEDIWADRQRVWATAVMGEVLKGRLLEQLREVEGVTYSPSVGYMHSLTWPGWGYVSASVEVPPDKIAPFFADVRKIAGDLAAKPPTADEMQRALKPRVEGLQRAQLTNPYWLGQLSGAQADPRRLDLIREIVPGTAAVTAAQVQDAAKRFLREDAAFHLVIQPQAASASARPAAAN